MASDSSSYTRAYPCSPDMRSAQRLIDLGSCIDYLAANNMLVRVATEVDPEYELAGLAKKFEGAECVLFEKVKGSPFPVCIGLLWNRSTMGRLFQTARENVPFLIAQAIGSWRENKGAFPVLIQEQGPANEVIEPEVDLGTLPVPVHALADGGRYFDSSVVVVRNPSSGGLNSSVHRLMITQKDRLTFLIDPGRHLGEYVEMAEAAGKPLPVTINNGVGLAPWLASIIPQQGDGKLGIADHLVGQSIPLVKAQTVDVPAYAHAQVVLEAEIIPRVREREGPFAEVTGYYATADDRFVMRVKAITRRKHPVFQSILSGQEVWNAVGLTAEAKIFFTVRQQVPQLRAVYLSPGGCGFYGAVVQVDADRPGVGRAAIEETFKAFGPLQWVIAVDTDVNLYDPVEVDWAVTTRFSADRDLIILPNQRGHILNPMVQVDEDGRGGTVTKMGLDATVPYPKSRRFERVRFLDVDISKYEIREEQKMPVKGSGRSDCSDEQVS
ncbi:MAG TPA: UbiD family decarboxylase [Thermodesulfobacteriota bacterium]|nr:UbiD family decarboxylase [Thermodesulfobacteriota bacterium]